MAAGIQALSARVLAAALLLVAWAGCEERGAAPVASPAGPAGEVIHIEGSVTAARPGEEPRLLELGAAIHADDTITTPPSGEISIMIAHNKVRWDIGSGQLYRVDASRAWRAKAAGSGSALDEQGDLGTASAGRHGEREAGETQATAPVAKDADESDTAAAEPEAPPEAAGASARADKRPPAGGEAQPDRAVADRSKTLGMNPQDQALRGSGGPAAESKEVPMADPGKAAVAAPRLRVALGEIKVRGARSAADVATVYATFSAAACGGTATGAVVLRFEIAADGVVQRARVSGPAALVAQVKSCVVAAARRLRFPVVEGASNTFVDREIRFAPK